MWDNVIGNIWFQDHISPYREGTWKACRKRAANRRASSPLSGSAGRRALVRNIPTITALEGMTLQRASQPRQSMLGKCWEDASNDKKYATESIHYNGERPANSRPFALRGHAARAPKHRILPIRAAGGDGGAFRRCDSARKRVAVRAEVGRLPLPALPRWRQGRAALEIGRRPHPLFSRTGRCRAKIEGDRFPARRRNHDAARQGVFVRRSAAADSSRREPRQEIGAGNAGAVYRIRSVGARERQKAVRPAAQPKASRAASL